MSAVLNRECDISLSSQCWLLSHWLRLKVLSAQDLAPRAYLITPLHSNAIILTWSIYDGSINYNGALPVSGATGTYSVPIFSYYHSFGFFGRSANITASLPYGGGTLSGHDTGR